MRTSQWFKQPKGASHFTNCPRWAIIMPNYFACLSQNYFTFRYWLKHLVLFYFMLMESLKAFFYIFLTGANSYNKHKKEFTLNLSDTFHHIPWGDLMH